MVCPIQGGRSLVNLGTCTQEQQLPAIDVTQRGTDLTYEITRHMLGT